jgi:hypothetical protein
MLVLAGRFVLNRFWCSKLGVASHPWNMRSYLDRAHRGGSNTKYLFFMCVKVRCNSLFDTTEWSEIS